MKPPYEITPSILSLVSKISEKLGEIKAAHLNRPPTERRKKNRIKTIQSSLEIEGNTMTEEQITALLNNQKVIAPKEDIIEVKNAIEVYSNITDFKFDSISDFKNAHKLLLKGLITNAGKYRKTGVGIVKGSEVTHVSPPGNMVEHLMKDLFNYIKNDDDIALIKSCVFRYELEFIHPFIDGNGRMGRLWQTIILMQYNSVFEFLPIEKIIKEKQKEYYNILMQCDKQGKSTLFIEFMLAIIEESLEDLLKIQKVQLSGIDRIKQFKEISTNEFSRKDYMRQFKEISTATASRDLKEGVEQNLLIKTGDGRTTKYVFKK